MKNEGKPQSLTPLIHCWFCDGGSRCVYMAREFLKRVSDLLL